PVVVDGRVRARPDRVRPCGFDDPADLVGDGGRDGPGNDVVEVERLAVRGGLDRSGVIDHDDAVREVGVDTDGIVGGGDARGGVVDQGKMIVAVRSAGRVDGAAAGRADRAAIVDGCVRAGRRGREVPDDGGAVRRAEYAAGRQREAVLAADHRSNVNAGG